MPTGRYKITKFGPAVGEGVTGSSYIALQGVAKKATAGQPFIVANELICNHIARILLLPCPPGALTDHEGEPYFFSLDFNFAGQSLPPIDAAAVVAEKPRDSWAIITFDVLIMNSDRHNKNISYDTTTKRIQIFDHSHALLSPQADIPQRLAASVDDLAIGGHCLAREINTWDGFDLAIARIQRIPDDYIDGIVDAGSDVGLPAAHKGAVATFLKARRDRVGGLIRGNVASFPKLPRVQP